MTATRGPAASRRRLLHLLIICISVTCSLEVRETDSPPLAQHGFGTPNYGSPVHTYANLPPEYDYHLPVAAYAPPVHARTLIRAPRSNEHPGSGTNTSLPQHDQSRPTTLPLSQQARTASRSSSDMARLSHNISAILENLLKNYNNQVRPGYHEVLRPTLGARCSHSQDERLYTTEMYPAEAGVHEGR
ncbi:uncharacterized protein LOC125041741 [Penaeus chinensis]|uniref:uncharacterized protein LOC125041741 n=1 Tax=Penaeus chinensis TaxID=139456 RepID=UPI001FB7F06A|nr:uncharacterized protein LOC125041741 [Penaeus chinensis]